MNLSRNAALRGAGGFRPSDVRLGHPPKVSACLHKAPPISDCLISLLIPPRRFTPLGRARVALIGDFTTPLPSRPARHHPPRHHYYPPEDAWRGTCEFYWSRFLNLPSYASRVLGPTSSPDGSPPAAPSYIYAATLRELLDWTGRCGGRSGTARFGEMQFLARKGRLGRAPLQLQKGRAPRPVVSSIGFGLQEIRHLRGLGVRGPPWPNFPVALSASRSRAEARKPLGRSTWLRVSSDRPRACFIWGA